MVQRHSRRSLLTFRAAGAHLWDAAILVLRTVFGGATIPLLWLAVAGIIYGVRVPDWRGTARRVVGDRADRVFDRAAAGRKRFDERGWHVPTTAGERIREWVSGRLGDYKTIVDSARLILHGGVLAISLYVVGFLVLAWLDMAGAFYHPEVSIGYLFRFVAWLFGPHPLSFWNGFADTIALVSHIIVEPLRVCLIASTVAYCLEQVRTEEITTAAAP